MRTLLCEDVLRIRLPILSGVKAHDFGLQLLHVFLHHLDDPLKILYSRRVSQNIWPRLMSRMFEDVLSLAVEEIWFLFLRPVLRLLGILLVSFVFGERRGGYIGLTFLIRVNGRKGRQLRQPFLQRHLRQLVIWQLLLAHLML